MLPDRVHPICPAAAPALRPRPRSTVDPADDLQVHVLETLERAENYNGWITSLIQAHLGDHPIEVGSGLG